MKRILAMIGVGIALVAFSFVVDGASSGASDVTSSTANPQGSSGGTDPCGCQTSSRIERLVEQRQFHGVPVGHDVEQ